MSPRAQPPCSIDLVTATGHHVEAPSLDAIRGELDRLARSPRGATVTLVSGARSLQVKYRPDRGFDVLTFRQDHPDDASFALPARVVWKAEAAPGGAAVACSALLGCIASFLTPAAA